MRIPISFPRNTISREIIIRSNEIVFRSLEIVFRLNEMIIRSNEIVFRSNEIVIRSLEIIFRSNEIVFRSNEILFRGNEIGILTTFFSSYVPLGLPYKGEQLGIPPVTLCGVSWGTLLVTQFEGRGKWSHWRQRQWPCAGAHSYFNLN